jgi:hypothetical protein
MFSMLSSACRDEILNAFASSAVKTVKNILNTETHVPVKTADTIGISAFESASLTFGKPLVLPAYNKVVAEPVAVPVTEPLAEPVTEPLAEPLAEPVAVPENKVIRIASSFPIAKATDRYSLAPLAVLHRVCNDIDNGLFVSNLKSVSWSKGSKYHHMDWDVKKVVMEVKFLQPATSLQIDQALPTMDRYRVTAILRELRKQGILIVS